MALTIAMSVEVGWSVFITVPMSSLPYHARLIYRSVHNPLSGINNRHKCFVRPFVYDERNGASQAEQHIKPRNAKSLPMSLRMGSLALPAFLTCTLSNVASDMSGSCWAFSQSIP